jgi:GNAT superfamily N-acetyltransferase
MNKEQFQAALDDPEMQQNPGLASRKIAEQQIDNGILRGYLAYVDGKSIGWCNANDRANYPAEPYYDEVLFHAPVEMKEKAVVCFEIAPECRGNGVATALLAQAIADAKIDGFVAIVGFPVMRDERYEWDYAGPVRLYERAGFSNVLQKDGNAIMRKELI